MAKNSAVQRIHDIEVGIKEADARMKAIVDEVIVEEREKKRLGDPLLLAIPEQIARMNERVDESAKKYWESIGHVHTATSFVPGELINVQYVNLDAVDAYACAYFTDTIKKIRADRIRGAARGDELPSAEIARRITDIDSKILAAWTEYEGIAVILEESNFQVDRDAREPVPIFLEHNPDANTINDDKLDRLRRRRHQFRGEDDSIHHELVVLQAEEVALLTELDAYNRQPRVLRSDLESVNARIAANAEKQAPVQKKRTDLTNSNSAAFKLLNKCEQFLKEHSIGKLGLAHGIVRG